MELRVLRILAALTVGMALALATFMGHSYYQTQKLFNDADKPNPASMNVTKVMKVGDKEYDLSYDLYMNENTGSYSDSQPPIDTKKELFEKINTLNEEQLKEVLLKSVKSTDPTVAYRQEELFKNRVKSRTSIIPIQLAMLEMCKNSKDYEVSVVKNVHPEFEVYLTVSTKDGKKYKLDAYNNPEKFVKDITALGFNWKKGGK